MTVNENKTVTSELDDFNNEVLEQFNDRVLQIATFIDFVKDLEQRTDAMIENIESNLPILKASTLLLLYNILESTASNVKKLLTNAINNARIEYAEATKPIQILWNEYQIKMYEQSRKKRAESLQAILDVLLVNNKLNFIISDAESNKEFEGNVDVKLIREFASQYGYTIEFSDKPKSEVIRNQIVNLRNKLGHGNLTFEEVGRTLLLDAPENRNTQDKNLYFFKEAVIDFLIAFLRPTEDYLINQKYKKPQP